MFELEQHLSGEVDPLLVHMLDGHQIPLRDKRTRSVFRAGEIAVAFQTTKPADKHLACSPRHTEDVSFHILDPTLPFPPTIPFLSCTERVHLQSHRCCRNSMETLEFERCCVVMNGGVLQSECVPTRGTCPQSDHGAFTENTFQSDAVLYSFMYYRPQPWIRSRSGHLQFISG